MATSFLTLEKLQKEQKDSRCTLKRIKRKLLEDFQKVQKEKEECLRRLEIIQENQKIPKDIPEIQEGPEESLCKLKLEFIEQDRKLQNLQKDIQQMQKEVEQSLCKVKTNERISRKEFKNVKSITVTQGKMEDYDIEKVLKNLEIEENPSKKQNPKSKKKFKKKPHESIIADNDSSELMESVKAENVSVELVEPVVSSTNDEAKIACSPNPNDLELEDVDNECTICFCIRENTFAIIPCGHATFCEDCSLRLCNDTKRCPTCQTPTTGRLRIFQ